MTNEQAIGILKAANLILGVCTAEMDEAFDMAISALKAQQAAGDTISRDAALEACYKGWNKDYKEIAQDIKDLPPAQPKLNKEKISDLLWSEYREKSSHLSAEGVVARRFFCKELWKELFGEEETPVWMTW